MEELEKCKLYDQALDKWGKESQIFMAVEEMAELMQILSHTYRKNRKITYHQIANEIADVKLMMEQMENVFSCSDLVNKAFEEKLLKLKKYLED